MKMSRAKWRAVAFLLLGLSLVAVGVTISNHHWRWDVILAALVGYWTCLFNRWLEERIQNPYGWTCDIKGCGFNMRTSHEKLIDKMRVDHMYHSHGITLYERGD